MNLRKVDYNEILITVIKTVEFTGYYKFLVTAAIFVFLQCNAGMPKSLGWTWMPADACEHTARHRSLGRSASHVWVRTE